MAKFSNLQIWNYLLFRNFSSERKINARKEIAVGMRLGLLWASAAVGFVGLVFGFDLIGGALEDCVTVIFEFLQENLETMYRKGFKLDLYHAQMATAYTGFVALLGIGFFLYGKCSFAFRAIRASWIREREKAKELLSKHLDNIKDWWGALDNFNKFSAAVGLVVLVIPFLSFVCIALGKVVAQFV